ncbi:MAG: hypothetical protein ACK5TK_14450 [Betaproteobacteria bacterium]
MVLDSVAGFCVSVGGAFSRSRRIVFRALMLGAVLAPGLAGCGSDDALPPSAPTIVAQPADTSVVAGQDATFRVVANGNPAPSYRWQQSFDSGATWIDLAVAGPSYTLAQTRLTQNGLQFRAIVENAAGSVASLGALLSVTPQPVPPDFVQQPQDATVLSGQTAVFAVAATASPSPSYQWQISTDSGATWSPVDAGIGGTTPLFSTAPTQLADNGRLYRCVATNSAGTATSRTAVLTVQPAPALSVVTQQPQNASVLVGQPATFSVVAVGTPSPTYRWQVSLDSGTSWSDVLDGTGATTASYTTAATDLGFNGRNFRVVLHNATGTVISATALLTVSPVPTAPAITQQPANATVIAGQAATFSVTAAGTPTPGYQWQKSSDGVNWTPITGATYPSYTTNATATTDDGTRYRVRINNGVAPEAISNVVVLTVQPAPALPVVTQQPQNASVLVGQPATFSVVAVGTPSPTYRWQVSLDSGASWSDVSGGTGANSPNYSTTPTDLGFNGRNYRVLVQNPSATVASATALLSVDLAPAAPVVTQQPADAWVTVGQAATFSVAASGVPTPTYQWQSSTDGGTTWTSISGATTSAYTTTAATATMNGTRYRAVVANGVAPEATSSSARLEVLPRYQVEVETSPGSGAFDIVASGLSAFAFPSLTLAQVYDYRTTNFGYNGPLRAHLLEATSTVALVQGSDGFGILFVHGPARETPCSVPPALAIDARMTWNFDAAVPPAVVAEDEPPFVDATEQITVSSIGPGQYRSLTLHGFCGSWSDGGLFKVTPPTVTVAEFTYVGPVGGLLGWQFIAPAGDPATAVLRVTLPTPSQLNRRVRIGPMP